MNFTEMKEKTKVQIVGISNGIGSYTKKDTGVTYHSVDLLVKGHRNMVNVSLPENFDPAQFEDGKLVNVAVVINVYNGRVILNAQL
jgi:hypothetical protein